MGSGLERFGHSAGTGDVDTFSVFLSHRYKATEANLYFYNAIRVTADINFRVDRGTVSTSTTRLERMIRDADGFVGIFSIPGDARDTHSREKLAELSRYFRLELDMAIRSGKPSAIFFDQRYGNLFKIPQSIISYQYNAQEIANPRHSTARMNLEYRIREFLHFIQVSAHADPARRTRRFDNNLVGILLPPYRGILRGLSISVHQLVTDMGFEVLELPWQPHLDSDCLTRLSRCDWVVLDSSDPASNALLGFLHGWFIPTLRIRHGNSDGSGRAPSQTEDVLYGALEVGYQKEVVLWRTEDDLLTGLEEKISALKAEPEWIGDEAGAVEYFTSAARRKEEVFLSYAGEDSAVGKDFAKELGRHFQKVFDYRTPGIMEPGRPWVDQVYSKLSAAGVGVLLLSSSYRKSPYCMDEARVLFTASQEKDITLLPVKLDDTPPPDFLTVVQYERLVDRTPIEIISDLARRLP